MDELTRGQTRSHGPVIAFWSLVTKRHAALARFHSWAGELDEDPKSCRRFEMRRDVASARAAMRWFDEPWWGLVVYTCFDSLVGTKAVAKTFARELSADDAREALAQIHFPKGSVLGHRKQATLTGAKQALVAACEHVDDFRGILLGAGSFEQRYEALRALRARQWGRTTCFDLLARAGLLGIGGHRYRPAIAFLAGSTGPGRGFETVWGVTVTRANAVECEALLHWWTANWHEVCKRVSVQWTGAPLDSADLENYLCIYDREGASAGGAPEFGSPPPPLRARHPPRRQLSS